MKMIFPAPRPVLCALYPYLQISVTILSFPYCLHLIRPPSAHPSHSSPSPIAHPPVPTQVSEPVRSWEGEFL